jgi:hypothetical protein
MGMVAFTVGKDDEPLDPAKTIQVFLNPHEIEYVRPYSTKPDPVSKPQRPVIRDAAEISMVSGKRWIAFETPGDVARKLSQA